MYYIGIDIGGTNLKAGLVDESYQIVAVKKAPLRFTSMEQMGETLAGWPPWAWAFPARWTTGPGWSSRR